jgi:hypothetical protein
VLADEIENGSAPGRLRKLKASCREVVAVFLTVGIEREDGSYRPVGFARDNRTLGEAQPLTDALDYSSSLRGGNPPSWRKELCSSLLRM